jgi:hypothetical protein
MKPSLLEVLFVISAGSIYIILHLLTYFVDPDPRKSAKEKLGCYQLNELKRISRKSVRLTARYLRGIAKWTSQTLL